MDRIGDAIALGNLTRQARRYLHWRQNRNGRKVKRMAFKLVICPPNYQEHWPDLLRQEIPDIDVHLCPTVGEAMEVIGDADAAFGDIVPELLERAEKAAVGRLPPGRAPGGLLHPRADRERSHRHQHPRNLQRPHQRPHHGLPAGLCPRGFQVYIPQQVEGVWRQGYQTIYLPEATAVVVGVWAASAARPPGCAPSSA